MGALRRFVARGGVVLAGCGWDCAGRSRAEVAAAAPTFFSVAPDTPEANSTEEIARATTEPRFSSPWVAYVPASSTVRHRVLSSIA